MKAEKSLEVAKKQKKNMAVPKLNVSVLYMAVKIKTGITHKSLKAFSLDYAVKLLWLRQANKNSLNSSTISCKFSQHFDVLRRMGKAQRDSPKIQVGFGRVRVSGVP